MADVAEDAALVDLLHFLRDHRGFDFTSYKHNTLSRRIQKRMHDIGVEDYSSYIDYLEVHPDEFPELFNTILINVTSFFRDEDPWDQLRDVLVPELLASRADDEPLRLWSAGCASGEEAYSLAIMLVELIGPDAFSERVKIYATDVDEDALAAARNGVYERQQLETMPPELVERWFEPMGSRFRFDGELRRNLIFGRHDITKDAPISHLDMLVCRNTLMYFNAEAQTRVLPRFHYALRPDGLLFLGRAEMLLTHSDLFTPIDMARRIFRPVPREAPLPLTGLQTTPSLRGTKGPIARLRDVTFDAGHVAELIIDLDAVVVSANALARAGFGVHADDIGRPLRDLEVSYRPVELRSRIEQAFAEGRTIQIRNVERVFPQGDPQYLDVVLSPLSASDGSPLGMSVKFVDVTRFIMLQMDLKRSNEELEAAYEELQSTNEELETTNEELQSTVEELETTNEELQSTNEELETMNEELQSTNEELETMNVELRMRTDELDRGSRFSDALFDALSSSVIALDHDRRVLLWSRASTELWGLTREEAEGRTLDALDFGLPLDQIRSSIDAVADGDGTGTTTVLQAVNRRGHHIVVDATVKPIRSAKPHDGIVLILTVRPS